MTNHEQAAQAMALILLSTPDSEWRGKLINTGRLYNLSHDEWLDCFSAAKTTVTNTLNAGPQQP